MAVSFRLHELLICNRKINPLPLCLLCSKTRISNSDINSSTAYTTICVAILTSNSNSMAVQYSNVRCVKQRTYTNSVEWPTGYKNTNGI